MCQRQLKKPRVSEERNIAGVKCKKDVMCYFEKGCVSAMARAVSGLRRTDELMFSEIG